MPPPSRATHKVLKKVFGECTASAADITEQLEAAGNHLVGSHPVRTAESLSVGVDQSPNPAFLGLPQRTNTFGCGGGGDRRETESSRDSEASAGIIPQGRGYII